MGTTDEVHVVFLQEARDDIGTKGKGHAAVVLAPSSNVLVGVRPQQVAEKAAVRYLERLANRPGCSPKYHHNMLWISCENGFAGTEREL